MPLSREEIAHSHSAPGHLPLLKRYRQLNLSSTAYRLATQFDSDASDSAHLVVCSSATELELLAEEVTFFLREKECIARFPSWDVLPFEALSPTVEISAQRLSCLTALLQRRRVIVFTTGEALLQRIISPQVLSSYLVRITRGENRGRDALIELLDWAGYVRTSLAEECGQMAIRGAIVDLCPPSMVGGIRVEFLGDVVDSIRVFDPATQRSSLELEEVVVVPVSEVFVQPAHSKEAQSRLAARGHELQVPSRSLQAISDALLHGIRLPGMEQLNALFGVPLGSLQDYFHAAFTVSLVNELSIRRAVDDFEVMIRERAQAAEDGGRLIPVVSEAYFTLDYIADIYFRSASIAINSVDVFTLSDEAVSPDTDLKGNGALAEALTMSRKSDLPLAPLAAAISARLRERTSVAITVSSETRARRMCELLDGYGISAPLFVGSFSEWLQHSSSRVEPGCYLLSGIVRNGFQALNARFQLIAEGEIFPGAPTKRTLSSHTKLRKLIGTANQFTEGDYVVHVDRGIAIYRGLKQLLVEGSVSDFLHLEYAEGVKLFVPVENIGKVQKYIGAEGQSPALTRLGGHVWDKTKEKVREQVAELAGQLVSLYAARDVLPGYPYPPFDSEDQEFADTFAYVETPDQQRAIDDVLADMAKPKPMDRLVCGDVGYGKTEVALRAAYKAVQCGKQVAVLVPTTILAEQHFATFCNRLASYPISVACVSRFITAQQNRETLTKVSEGKVDILIGTHRLLQKDVFFKDLGLIIIDEEHRFGVAHKEKLKRYRRDVDVLTLTATPIPRTLHMSLLGIRDLSVIETAPTDRHVIRTFIAPFNEPIVREAILREKARGGQCFYIHNRVANIAAVTQELSEIVPEVKISFAHGQMKEHELEMVMHRFIAKEVDVLVSTTIVESGLDIPNANTIIIRQADMFGLAELYQLRGRVGRSSRRAYAYLFVSDPKTLGADAKKRLAVLQSLDDLGVGFRLALQDMEIRGAGNLLGKDQSGEVNVVGYELYSQILKEAVSDVRFGDRIVGQGEQGVFVDPEVTIGFPAHIPLTFIPDVGERLVLYQRLVDLESEEQARELAEEIEDRFGHPPEEVKLLVQLMAFRVLLKRAGILTATYRSGVLSLAMHPLAVIDPERVVLAVERSRGAVLMTPQGVLRMRIPEELVRTPADLHVLAAKQLTELGTRV